MPLPYSLDLARLGAAYAAGELTPTRVVTDIHAAIEACRATNPAWIAVAPLGGLLEQARGLEARAGERARLPLYGVPFAVKDNIDVAGYPTTAACPAFAYTPRASAFAVQRLLDAGAICVGKTNLDQFATGLVGTRSPYGACVNPFDPAYISGGSSSGSAVAVSLGQVSFALGTDTAGSGRVPAGFCNVVGLKPTRGLISMSGVVPACRSLDCLSIFALTCDDARLVFDVARGPDAKDLYSRDAVAAADLPLAQLRCGVPRTADLEFFGDDAARSAFAASVDALRSIGADIVEIDYAPFSQAASLLYDGPWIAERLAAIRDFFRAQPEALLPVTRDIIGAADRFQAVDAFEAQYRLRELQRRSAPTWSTIDVLAVPTSGTIYTLQQVAAEPVRRNTDLGYYTNFVNLLDLAAIAVPGGFRSDGLPAGITLIAPALHDLALAEIGARLQQTVAAPLGTTSHRAASRAANIAAARPNEIVIAVVGAHLSGMPLNHQLTDRGARLICTRRTARAYRLFVLPGSQPLKPGLVRSENGGGTGIEVELWSLPAEHVGPFIAGIAAPLGIGTLELDNGEEVKGFVCEHHAVNGASDISSFGGWRAYIESLRHPGHRRA